MFKKQRSVLEYYLLRYKHIGVWSLKSYKITKITTINFQQYSTICVGKIKHFGVLCVECNPITEIITITLQQLNLFWDS